MDYKIGNGTFIIGSCFDTMKDIKDKSIDLTITSPPYNMNLRVRKDKYCSRQIVKELTTKYNDFDDNLPMDEYYKFLDKTIEELLRISKLVCFNIQVLTGNKPAVFKIIGKYHDKIKEIVIWDKVNSEPAIGERILNSQFELIIFFSDNAIIRQFEKANFSRGTLNNIWQIKKGKKPMKDHGAVFPEELVSRLIENFSNEGDMIFDPFGGSGTTALAAEKLNRKWISCELSEN